MTAHELLIRLRALNARIFVEQGRLRVVEPAPKTLDDETWDQLQRHKEELRRVLQNAARTKRQIPISRVQRPQEIPLSFAQQRLWFLAQMEGVSEVYHMPQSLRLHGKLDRSSLKRALDRIVYRHEALRTTFHSVNGQPIQRVHASGDGFALQEHDLSASAEPETELKLLARHEARIPFDLESGPLIRGRLIGMAVQEHVLLITMHHIVSDGWSLGVFIRELSSLYHAYHNGGEDPLPPLDIQYADYAIWQQQRLNGEELQQEREYWRRALEGAPASLDLPTDRPRPVQQSFDGNFLPIQLDASLTRELKILAHRNEMTLYMLVAAAWAIVLSRLSGQEEVVIGTVSANRARPELEGLIGFFVNTLALRLEIPGTIAELLQNVRARILDIQEHQELPFEQIVEIVKPPRSLAQTPIFQVMLAWQSNNQEIPKFTGLKLEPEPGSYTVAKFDLMLDLRETGDWIVGGLRYATAIFNRGTIERHAGYLRQALAAMVADSRQAVTEIDLLSPEEHRLLKSWNATEAPYPEHQCIHQLFEEQARKSPDATAIVHEGRSLSYFELNQLSNRLAHQLIALGLKPDGCVAICVKRSLNMVVGMLAILKAGGAYVPLDPSYPSMRLMQILADASPKIVLSDFSGRKALGERALEHLTVINLDEADLRRAEQPAADPDPEALGLNSHHLAYVIYTSGSTGTPKGVMIEHANATNLITWSMNVFPVSEMAHTLFATSIQFDVSVFECFAPLSCGATLHLVDDVLAMLQPKHSVSLMCAVPSAMTALLDQDAFPPPLSTINLGGEPLKKIVVEKIFEQSDVARVCNLYGPTETTTYSSWISFRPNEPIVESIGRPVANTQIYLLDKNKHPVPLGAVGELYIAGAGVARGYLNRPELTKERFLANPFSTDPEARMYKTGDLGRFREDGTIEYLGRNDFQVKIRGFRVELEEIEAALASCAGVREAVVLAREEHLGDKRLVAYITANGANSALPFDVEAVRSHLSSLLPGYMVPAIYVLLEKLPLTPNGKLDRKALPLPDDAVYATRSYEPPVGDMEMSIARAWREALKLEQIGRHENFFEIGGHSLLIVKIMSLLRQFGIRTTIADLFNHPTIQSLADFLSKRPAESFAHRVQRIREGSIAPLFLAHDGGGSELYFSPLAKFLPRELPVYGLPSVPSGEPQLHSMRAMAERLHHMIREAQPEGPYRLAGWSFGGLLAYETAQLLLEQGDTLEFLGLIDARNMEGRSVENRQKRTPEAVLVDLCERQMGRRSGDSSAPLNAPDVTYGFNELLEHYRAMGALPDNFIHLAPEDARAECCKLEHHLHVMEAYTPRPIGIPVHLFVAGERLLQQAPLSPSLGWERCVPHHLLHVHIVPGNHHSMMRPPHIKTLGRKIIECLGVSAMLPDPLHILHAAARD